MKSRAVYRFIIRAPNMNLFLDLKFFGSGKLKELSKKTGIDYSHLNYMLREMEREGLIKRTVESKYRMHHKISLTEKGAYLALALERIKLIVENWETKKNKR